MLGSKKRSLKLTGTAAVSLLVLAACGGPDVAEVLDSLDDSDGTVQDFLEQLQNEVDDVTDESGAEATQLATSDSGQNLETLEFLVAREPNVPAGYTEWAGSCVADDDEARINYSVALPTGWQVFGTGSAGSGSSVLASDVYLMVSGDNDAEMRLDIERAMLDEQGNMITSDGEPWHSFDYTGSLSSSDPAVQDRDYTVTYTQAGSFNYVEQKIEVFHRDQYQDPEVVSTSAYAAVMDLVRMPARYDGGPIVTEKLLLSLEYDAQDGPIDIETATNIFASLALPQCEREAALIMEELVYQRDLNGDGEVATVEDLLG